MTTIDIGMIDYSQDVIPHLKRFWALVSISTRNGFQMSSLIIQQDYYSDTIPYDNEHPEYHTHINHWIKCWVLPVPPFISESCKKRLRHYVFKWFLFKEVINKMQICFF